MALQAQLATLEASLVDERRALLGHDLYRRLRGAGDLRVFVEHHVWAVWDFMSLLKALQRGLTCTELPWVPRGDPAARRFINEIVLAEESDEDGRGGHASHFELYRAAMADLGADTAPIDRFLAGLARGTPVRQALLDAPAPPPARAFVATTWDILETGSLPAIAAAFTLGREDPIPAMFQRIVDGLGPASRTDHAAFHRYLERHIHLDTDHHGPLARRLLSGVCGNDPRRWAEAGDAAQRALRARVRLWDAVAAAIRADAA